MKPNHYHHCFHPDSERKQKSTKKKTVDCKANLLRTVTLIEKSNR